MVETLEQILERIMDGFFALDRNWIFTYVNREASSYFMKTPEEMVGRNIWELFPIAVGSTLYNHLTCAMETNEVIHFEYKGLRTVRSYEVKAYPSENGLTVFFLEITERKRAEATIQELASIVQCSSDAILSGTLDGKITSFNSGAELMYGYRAKEIIGQHIRVLFSAGGWDYLSGHFKSVSQGQRVEDLKTQQLTRDGREITVLLSLFPINNLTGEIRSYSAIIKNVTRLSELEKEIARLDQLNLIGQMAAGIAHEIRNPITTVKGFLQLFSSRSDHNKDKECFDIMIQELDRANFIITEFLSLGKVKTENVEKKNINEILNKISPLILADALKRGHNITFKLDTVTDLDLDEKDIIQLIYNLVRNGLEAMPLEGHLSVHTYMEGCQEVVLSVSDQGAGINKTILDRVGTPFFSTKDHGTGLGLAVCYNIAKRYDAKIEIETGQQGTTFYVRFPTS